MTKPILFVDTVCPQPYDCDTLKAQALGGTEATVVRLAEKLGESVPVYVLQHNRSVLFQSDNVIYAPPAQELLRMDWQAVVFLRLPQHVTEIYHSFQSSSKWIWFHDLLSAPLFQHLKFMADQKIGAIVVSEFHKKQFMDVAKLDPLLKELPALHRLYNPIDDDLQVEATPINKNKLVFVSTPDKGLAYTLQSFEYISQYIPSLELHITHPGYNQSHPIFQTISQGKYKANIKFLGALPHALNIAHMRDALCLFFPNHVWPETFGIALAEANAIGTPVLTHPLGGALEALSNQDQFVNTHDLDAMTARLMHWQSGNRPIVHANADFRLTHIAKLWKELLYQIK